MKKFFLRSLVFSMSVLAFVACDSDDDSRWVEPETTTTGVYVLNSGSGSQIGAKLTYYDYSTGTVTKDVFTNKNGEELGKGGQDMIVYGSKMYITVTQSNCIYITDKKGSLLKDKDGNKAIIKPLNNKDQPQKPRSIVANGGRVYVSTYDGDILRIDTTQLVIDKKTATGGTYLEEMTIVNNKLYTVISDYTGTGIGKSVSVINLSSFSKESDIAVVQNPTKIKSDKNGNIYVISNGNYTEEMPSVLQKIDPNTSKVTTIGTKVATNMEVAGDKLLLMKEEYDFVAKKSTTTLSYYDIKENKIVDKPFVEDGKADLSNTYNITYDPASKNLYLATSDYVNEGSMHIFDSNGKYIKSFKTGGINPMGAYFLTEVK